MWWSRSGCPSGKRGRKSHTIRPHNRPLQSKTCMAILLASSHVPSGTWDEAGKLWITINSRPALIVRSGQRNIVRSDEIFPSCETT